METELAQAVDVHVIMARVKRIYILIIKVNKLFSFFSSWCFLSSYIRALVKVWENLKELWKHSPVEAYVPLLTK